MPSRPSGAVRGRGIDDRTIREADAWKVWIAFLGMVTLCGSLSTHRTEFECQRSLDLMCETGYGADHQDCHGLL